MVVWGLVGLHEYCDENDLNPGDVCKNSPYPNEDCPLCGSKVKEYKSPCEHAAFCSNDTCVINTVDRKRNKSWRRISEKNKANFLKEFDEIVNNNRHYDYRLLSEIHAIMGEDKDRVSTLKKGFHVSYSGHKQLLIDSWGNGFKMTQEQYDAIRDLGFKSVRVCEFPNNLCKDMIKVVDYNDADVTKTISW